MLFTWSTQNLCIVFSSWRISGPGTLVLSLLAIVLLTAGYEAVREASRRYDASVKDEGGVARKSSSFSHSILGRIGGGRGRGGGA